MKFVEGKNGSKTYLTFNHSKGTTTSHNSQNGRKVTHHKGGKTDVSHNGVKKVVSYKNAKRYKARGNKQANAKLVAGEQAVKKRARVANKRTRESFKKPSMASLRDKQLQMFMDMFGSNHSEKPKLSPYQTLDLGADPPGANPLEAWLGERVMGDERLYEPSMGAPGIFDGEKWEVPVRAASIYGARGRRTFWHSVPHVLEFEKDTVSAPHRLKKALSKGTESGIKGAYRWLRSPA